MSQTSFVHRRFVVPALVAFVTIAVLVLIALWMRPSLNVNGLSDGGAVTPSAFGTVEIVASGSQVEALLDGAAVPLRREGDRTTIDVPAPAEGAHTLQVRVPGQAIPFWGNETALDFTVDATPPALAMEAPVVPADAAQPTVLRGTALGASSLRVATEQRPLGADGTFEVAVPPRTASVDIEAADAAGNAVRQRVSVPAHQQGMRAVHMTAHAWSAASLRDPVMQMARERRIDTVQLDIKDESGQIGYLTRVPLANEIGAAQDVYDVRAALAELHAAGLRVVGRVVAFRDPVLAEASWRSGKTDRVLQNAAGTPWSGGYGQYSFTNFADPEVRAYNMAIAEEAAELGFDDILYDYVRRPDGAVSRMRIPGLTTTPERAIADFLGDSRERVRKHGALLGASVYGIAATRPTEIAQDIPAVAQNADYVSPMVYPSHWGKGEYGVAYPEGQPFDITARSLADFATLTGKAGSIATVVPWLQAFSLRESYGPAEIRAQIEAAESNGIHSFLLWNAGCRYPAESLDPVSAQ